MFCTLFPHQTFHCLRSCKENREAQRQDVWGLASAIELQSWGWLVSSNWRYCCVKVFVELWQWYWIFLHVRCVFAPFGKCFFYSVSGTRHDGFDCARRDAQKLRHFSAAQVLAFLGTTAFSVRQCQGPIHGWNQFFFVFQVINCYARFFRY